VCGKESPVFQPGQTLAALMRAGVTAERRIVGAAGHDPVLRNIPMEWVDRLRRQVELVNRIGETRPAAIAAVVAELQTRGRPLFDEPLPESALRRREFTSVAPGGRREPLWYDPKGFFVIALDRGAEEIIVRHFQRDYAPAHEMRGHSAEAIVLGLLRMSGRSRVLRSSGPRRGLLVHLLHDGARGLLQLRGLLLDFLAIIAAHRDHSHFLSVWFVDL